MRPKGIRLVLLAVSAALLSACADTHELVRWGPMDTTARHWERLARDKGLARRILALDPENLSVREVRETLSKGPAPWILPIAPLEPWAREFSVLLQFLLDMGYPRGRIGNPPRNDYKYGWQDRADVIAGTAAWFYERDGMYPMMMGWSGGAILTVAVLHDMSNSIGSPIKTKVYNVREGRFENRDWVTDPYTGKRRPITSLKISYAAALAAGGLGRSGQARGWAIREGLRLIPNSAIEFLGWTLQDDLFGADALTGTDEEFARANTYRPMGTAKVRSIIADSTYDHFSTIHCERISGSEEGRKWVDAYRPPPGYGLRDYQNDHRFSYLEGRRNMWCGEVWYGVKKHWALEAQRVARAVLAGKAPRRERKKNEKAPRRGNAKK